MQIATFALTMAVGQLTPGPDMLLILKNTLNQGLAAGLATIAGICIGIVLHVTLVFTGLAALLAGYPAVFRTVQLLGACYLLWIAWKLLRHLRIAQHSAAASQPGKVTAKARFSQSFREGFLTNITNVKVMILFSSILGPLAMGPAGIQWIYGAIIIIEAALIWPLFAWLMQRPSVRHAFFYYQNTINLAFALLIACFALRLLLGL